MTEMRFQTSDWSNGSKVAQLGRALNANTIIRGQLMNLQGQIIIIANVLDINTAQILSSSRLQLYDMLDALDQMPEFVTSMMAKLPGGSNTAQKKYNIGDKGPGGGFIFYNEGGMYMECSVNLGSFNWNTAISTAKNYKGGGLNDWRLPTRNELNLIYQNLKARGLGGMFEQNWYWSSSESRDNLVWHQDFSDGDQYYTAKDVKNWVRAVRAF
jgi:hypothetical protein